MFKNTNIEALNKKYFIIFQSITILPPSLTLLHFQSLNPFQAFYININFTKNLHAGYLHYGLRLFLNTIER